MLTRMSTESRLTEPKMWRAVEGHEGEVSSGDQTKRNDELKFDDFPGR